MRKKIVRWAYSICFLYIYSYLSPTLFYTFFVLGFLFTIYAVCSLRTCISYHNICLSLTGTIGAQKQKVIGCFYLRRAAAATVVVVVIAFYYFKMSICQNHKILSFPLCGNENGKTEKNLHSPKHINHSFTPGKNVYCISMYTSNSRTSSNIQQ